MISAFGYSCHSFFSCETILPGAQHNGYWKKESMAKQLQSAIEEFNTLHPKCTYVFCFDKSTNQSAMPVDALNAHQMNMGPGGKQIVSCDSGYHYNQDGQWVIQSMTDANGVPCRDLSTIHIYKPIHFSYGLYRIQIVSQRIRIGFGS